MAETTQTPTQQPPMTQAELKYLEFVQVAALHMVGYLANVYDYAKNNSGPLKPGVQSVEGTVKTVIGPVYEKFHDVPFEVLKFVDSKVNVSVNEVERHVPAMVKQAPEVARAVATEVQRTGVVGTATGVAKNVYTKYEPVAEQYAATAWHKLNKLPLFPHVAHIMVPTAAYCSEKYNEVVRTTAEKGYTVSSYLPLVPTERIAKVFGGEEAEPAVTLATGSEVAVA